MLAPQEAHPVVAGFSEIQLETVPIDAADKNELFSFCHHCILKPYFASTGNSFTSSGSTPKLVCRFQIDSGQVVLLVLFPREVLIVVLRPFFIDRIKALIVYADIKEYEKEIDELFVGPQVDLHEFVFRRCE